MANNNFFKDANKVFDLNKNDADQWTTELLKDELFACLAKIAIDNTDGKFIDDRKYYKQVKDLEYRTPLTEQVPKPEESVPFVINFSDFSPRVQKEFQEYCNCKGRSKKEIAMFLKEIAVRFFENIDFNRCHLSVMRKLRVVLEQ